MKIWVRTPYSKIARLKITAIPTSAYYPGRIRLRQGYGGTSLPGLGKIRRDDEKRTPSICRGVNSAVRMPALFLEPASSSGKPVGLGRKAILTAVLGAAACGSSRWSDEVFGMKRARAEAWNAP